MKAHLSLQDLLFQLPQVLYYLVLAVGEVHHLEALELQVGEVDQNCHL